jgi:hypothetical protein
MDKFTQLIKLRKEILASQKPPINKMAEADKIENNCWDGYEPIGVKVTEDGRTVPNCVPIKENQSKQKFVIPSPEGGEDEQTYISRCMGDIVPEYGNDVAAGICYSKWNEK